MLYRMKDPPDIAVFELDDTAVTELSSRRFLRLSDFGLQPEGPYWYWVFGFPAELTQDVPSRELFYFKHLSLLAPLFQGDVALENYDPSIHFLLDAARNDIWLPDGRPGDLPIRLEGVSGCGIWQSEWPKDGCLDRWDPTRTRIVGIQTSYYRSRSLIKATPWAAVAYLLHQVRPDLRGALELSFGPPH
jgi:hypothetical protein